MTARDTIESGHKEASAADLNQLAAQASIVPPPRAKWNDKDRVGVLLDFTEEKIIFYLNDKAICQPVVLEKGVNYAPVFGIGCSRHDSAHFNVIVPPRLKRLPPMGVELSKNIYKSTESGEKRQNKHK